MGKYTFPANVLDLPVLLMLVQQGESHLESLGEYLAAVEVAEESLPTAVST